MEKILIVEDAPDFQLIVETVLKRKYRAVIAGTIAQARARIQKESWDLILLDVSLPDGDGFKFCVELRAQDKTRSLPVIFLTSRSELTDKLLGFSLGADDYVVKPFEALELLARVEAKLSRIREQSKGDEVWVVGPLKMDLLGQRVFQRTSDGKDLPLSLTPIEFRILYYLLKNEECVVSRERLLSAVWGNDTHVFDRATDKHVSSLRQKLGADGRLIETVSGVGYRFTSRPKL
jgi:two-component system, OmpR family, phosphate regulon response regulator PhoB